MEYPAKTASHIKQFFSVFSLFCMMIISCSTGSDDNPQPGILGSLTVNVEKTGSDSANPNGDGSGAVQFTLKADNADRYVLKVGDDILNAADGKFSYTFKGPGTNSYPVLAVAYLGEKSVSQTLNVTVYVTTANQLLWSDEFNYEGAPNPLYWTAEIGNGASGWGNNEVQYYTNRTENANVSNGTLKITMKKEAYEGFNYTSARLITKNKVKFKYGKVEFRAKLPEGGGTWPALWMLGNNIDTVPWPGCGEIDVMEHVGNNPGKIIHALHAPAHYGGNGWVRNTTVSGVSSEFHTYTVEWTPSLIKFYVDNLPAHEYANTAASPFNSDFFLLMNIAVGGTLGGNIDPALQQAVMEVDYVRVYQ